MIRARRDHPGLRPKFLAATLMYPNALPILDCLREPLLLLDADARVRFANAAFYRAFQVAPDETIGRSLYTLGNGQWNIAPLRALLQSVLAEQAPIDGFMVEHDFETIGFRAICLNARVFPAAADHEGLVVLAMEDVTEQRRAAAERDARTAELERSNEALSQFAGMASHDLRAPLRKLRSYSEMLMQSASARLDTQEHDYLRRIVATADRMRRLVDSMLALSRVTRGVAIMTDVDLDALARDTAADLETQVNDEQATIEVQSLGRVRGDPQLLRLVFQNLFDNALKFARRGCRPVIRVTAHRRDGALEVRVQDNGAGFDPAQSERIFEPFHRLATSESTPGNGMGLAICRRVVARHGGSLTAEASPGHGATFVLSLPLEPQQRIAS